MMADKKHSIMLESICKEIHQHKKQQGFNIKYISLFLKSRRMTMKNIFLGAMLLTSVNTFAASADGFHKRFELVRNEQGELVQIKDRTIATKFSVKPYLQQIKKDLLELKEYMNSHKAEFDGEIDGIISELGTADKAAGLNFQVVRDAVYTIPSLEVEDLMKAIQDHNMMEVYENRLTQEMMGLSLNTVANLNDSKYFYKRAVTYKAVTFALDYAKKHFSNIPVLNTISHVVVEIERMVRERRTFHQNMLLHYFENFSEAELGMTKAEVDLAWSSIYESRIQWNDFISSQNAANDWKNYGANIFYSGVRMANNKVRGFTEQNIEAKSRYNYAFVEVLDQGERKVLNLFDNQHMLSMKPAVAYNYDKPGKVKRTRQILSLAQIAMSFVPYAPGLKNMINEFINSTYVAQKQTEGALLGYFESQGNLEMEAVVKGQNLNPYETF